MTDSYVLDASAVLCLASEERGADLVHEVMPRAVITSVNFAEVVTKFHERGTSDDDLQMLLFDLKLSVIDFTEQLALSAAALRGATRAYGLSLGDRACLALAIERNAIAVTTDRAWGNLTGIARVKVVR